MANLLHAGSHAFIRGIDLLPVPTGSSHPYLIPARMYQVPTVHARSRCACVRDDLVRTRMGIQHACMHGETWCMRACRDPACAYAHGGLAWAWGSSVHGQRISAVYAYAWRPGACTHGDPACMCGDPVCAHMGILRACVHAWGPGACTHGGPVCMCGDPVCACMGILCGPGPCMRGIQHAQWGLDTCVQGSGMGVRIQWARAEDQYHV